MEPAIAVCAGVATITLTLGFVGSLPVVARRLAAVHVPLPTRPIAAVLMMTSFVVLLARPRPAHATVPPPIIRLADGADAGNGAADLTIPVPASPESTAPVGGSPSARSVQTESHGSGYVVQAGDSLWRIAERTLAARGSGEPTSADIAQFWPVIYTANHDLIGDNPNLIFPGQLLQLPEA